MEQKNFSGGVFGWHVILLVTTMLSAAAAAPTDISGKARRIVFSTGIEDGLAVQVGCDDGRLAAALQNSGRFLVQVLDRDKKDVQKARQYLTSRGSYGPVSAAHWRSDGLPYAKNLVKLLVVQERSGLSKAEIKRVLSPHGVACIRKGDGWNRIRNEWPEGMDEWSHLLHGPGNNAVSDDQHVGRPRHIQWRGTPLWGRSHDHLATTTTVVSSNNRIFYISDLGPAASVAMPSDWHLIARDAFSGVKLWDKPISPWANRLRGFRTGPPHLGRRVVAKGDLVYATLGLGKPVVKLHAGTGEVLQTYENTEGTEEIITTEGKLFVVIGSPQAELAAQLTRRRGADAKQVGKSILTLDASSGDTLWKVSGEEAGYVMPTTLAVADGEVFYQNTRGIVCRDAGSGQQQWTRARQISRSRLSWSTPTLVVQDGVIYSADRNPQATSAGPLSRSRSVNWRVTSSGGNSPPGKLLAFDAQTGERLWSAPAKEGYNFPVDVLVANELLWTGKLVQSGEPGITKGRDPVTGKVAFTRPRDQEFFRVGMSHHRCYRNKATEEYLVLGRSGTEFVDLETGEAVANHWVRGTCQYGVLPANGLLYAPPHACACFIRAKLKGFNALAPRRNWLSNDGIEEQKDGLVRGLAYDDPLGDEADGWPTYRRDAARSGAATCNLPEQLKTIWSAETGAELTAPVMADGRLLVGSKDDYTLRAFDAKSGKVDWAYITGAEIDSPPTVYRGRVIFGCADGWVYCLNATEGQLAWKYRAAPRSRWVVDRNNLESTWPVHGSVLVRHGVIYLAAGRSSYLDGGIFLYGLDPETGEKLFRRRLCSRNPDTGKQPNDKVHGFSMPGALPDVLSSKDDSIFMRHKRFNMQGEEQKQNVPHLMSSVGFLDDTWWHRTYWLIGTRMGAGWSNWDNVGKRVPAGRLLVRNGNQIYGFGRSNYDHLGSYVGLGDAHYRLFATSTEKDGGAHRWTRRLPFWVRAMTAGEGDRLVVAGPPVAKYMQGSGKGPDGMLGPTFGSYPNEYSFTVQNPQKALAAWRGQLGAKLWMVSGSDGEKLASRRLDTPPVFDSLIAAGGQIYVCTTGGKVLCLGEK